MNGSKSTKEKITDTALKLFEMYGYNKVTVDKIVQESGTSKGGFYHNFKSKDELLFTIHDYFITYVLDKAEEAYEKWNTPAERLYEIVKSFVMMFEKYRAHVTVFYQESLYLAAEFTEKVEKKRDRYKEIMFSVVQEGINIGEFRKEVPVEIMSMAIFGMINWTYRWYKTDGTYSLEEIAAIFADLIMHASLTDEAKQKQAYSRFFLTTQT
ncbi:TetR/AcrR family transcriptional regulator [Pueribacillus sp. YX66]|uniref:TetR/AcrR family transcriptional regulator n=1 Tax=Pueribacillus sp. YX66 TaxID=3229242 RepID=UPI00358D2031